MLLAAASAAREGASVLATTAALVAAGAAAVAVAVGVVNVILTARLSAKRELDAWRRGVVYPLITAVQAASHRHSTKVMVLVTLRQEGADAEEVRDLQAEASAAYLEISDRLAELEVVAPEMFLAEARLRTAHVGLSIFEHSPEQSEAQVSKDVQTARRAFLAAAHTVLGIKPKPGRWQRIRRWSSSRRDS
jgi:hypothetical protein